MAVNEMQEYHISRSAPLLDITNKTINLSNHWQKEDKGRLVQG